MKQLLWPRVQALWHKGRQLLIILAGMLLFWMIVMLSMARVLVFQGPAQEHLAHASPAFSSVVLLPPGTDVDPPILIGQSQLFDACPCVANPTLAHCTGVYPAIPPALATSQGTEACFDSKSVPLGELRTPPKMACMRTQAR